MTSPIISAHDPMLLGGISGRAHTVFKRSASLMQTVWFSTNKIKTFIRSGTKTFLFIHLLSHSFIHPFTHLFLLFIHVCVYVYMYNSNERCRQSLINVIEIKQVLIWLNLGLRDRFLDLTLLSLKSPGVHSGTPGSNEEKCRENITTLHNLSVLFFSEPDYRIGPCRHEGQPGQPLG